MVSEAMGFKIQFVVSPQGVSFEGGDTVNFEIN